MADYDPNVAAQKLGDLLSIFTGTVATDPISQTAQTSTQPTSPAPPPTPSATTSGGSRGEIGTREQDDFYKALLQRLNLPLTDANLTFMRAWNQAEGMDAGYFNPFATTQAGPGRNLNDVGVKAYDSFDAGVTATAETLQNGRYGGILAGLAASDPHQAAQGVADSPWGTGSLVLKVLGY